MAVSAGGIGFLSYNSDGDDDWSFVVLEDVAANEVLNFTDNGVQDNDSFNTGEQTITWTNNTGSAVPAGTIIKFSGASGMFDVGGTSGSSLGLTIFGDQITAYQGAEGSPTFIAMIHMNGDYDANVIDVTTSAKPSSLTDGTNTISIAPEIDNAAYTGPITATDAAGWRARLFDEINWTGHGGNAVAGSLDGQSSLAICFLAGSLIATPTGEVVVENLKIGDLVLTQSGAQVPIKWIGRQVLDKLRHGMHMQPVCIRAGALAQALPHSDLFVTADHGMIIDGLVINAAAMINGSSVDWVPMAELEDTFTVYHIETEEHDVILANGAPSETFVDAVERSHFDNFQEYLDLYGAEHIIPEMNRMRISSQRLLPEAIKSKLCITDDPWLGVKIA